MLIDNDKRFVELVLDNILWGNVHIEWDNIDDSKSKKFPSLDILIRDYIANRRFHNKQPKTLIFNLSITLEAERIFGNIIGQLIDRDQESKIKDLVKDNKQLVEQLSKAYIPSNDGKIGTT